MTELILAGAATSALTHFAMYGVSNIIEHETGCAVASYWHDSTTPTARIVADGIDEEQIAAAVRQHANRCAADGSWLHAEANIGGKPTAAFSPRIKTPSDGAEWKALQQIRHKHIDELIQTGEVLDLAMIGGLGEPAYWRFDGKDRRPDHGASRWEMKARNKGEEFVGNRLRPMAQVVADRSPAAILDGLTGERICDELSKANPSYSQTATGFTRPGPTDCAMAWCALWGITNFPLAHRVSTISTTPAAFPASVLHTRFMVLPVITRPVAAARVRSILVSGALRVQAEQQCATASHDPFVVDAARRWLESRGVAATVAFPIEKAGSDNAPQRFVLEGEIETLRTGESADLLTGWIGERTP
ncbi:hypothetical protein [Mycolicibacterium thermoresistibile]